MRLLRGSMVVGLVVLAVLMFPLAAAAGHDTDPRSKNMHPKGHSIEPGSIATGTANSDLAFWEDIAAQGSYDGFRLVDISSPGNPKELSDVSCNGNQGDVSIWWPFLFRSVDRPQSLPGNDLENTCAGTDAPSGTTGFEGIQIFDISDPTNPTFVTAVPTDCGSHTHTLVDDLANNRVLLYISSSFSAAFAGETPYGTTCVPPHGKFSIVEVPLDAPETASVIGQGLLGDSNACHDMAAFTGPVDRAVCAGRPNNVLFDITNPAVPVRLYSFTHPAVTGWHSGTFTWDGKIMAMGWEPGGGSQPRCRADSPPTEKAIYFYRVADGAFLGMWVLPRPQTAAENCTIHNYNVVPLRDRYVLVHGSYQSGTSVVDFTNPAAAFEVGWSDPPPRPSLTGAWSSYWYNGFIHESEIEEGLNIFNLSDRAVAGARKLPYLNPQTQDQLID